MSEISDAIEQTRRTWTSDDTPDLAEIVERAGAVPGFVRSLTEVLSADELTLIVEPKRATMKRGRINPQLDVAQVAAECETAGASAICVVTEPRLSSGDIEDVRAARGACGMPIIARDFIVDARQVAELRMVGADVVMSPAQAYVGRRSDEASVDEPALDALDTIVRTAHQLGMEFVLSVRSDEELAFALDTDADALNIDNRGDDGLVDVERTFDLLAQVPVGWPVISESIATLEQVPKLHRAGVDALLLDEGHLDTGLTSALAVYAALTSDG
jgi:indole-3-glycerol phosphate synthase